MRIEIDGEIYVIDSVQLNEWLDLWLGDEVIK